LNKKGGVEKFPRKGKTRESARGSRGNQGGEDPNYKKDKQNSFGKKRGYILGN